MPRTLPRSLAATLALTLALAGCPTEEDPPVGDGLLDADEFTRLVDGGIDDAKNSYPWALALFDGDGDGTDEIYLGTLGDALCLQTPLSAEMFQLLGGSPPDKWGCDETHWLPEDGDWTTYMVENMENARVYRGTFDDDGAVSWERVFQPNLLDAQGFRGAVVYDGALYMLSMNLNLGAMVYETTDGEHWTEASERGVIAGDELRTTSVRASIVYDGKLYVGSAETGTIYVTDDPAPGNWQRATSFGMVASGGAIHDQLIDEGTSTGDNTATTLNDTTKLWFPGRHADGWIVARITAGTGAGQESLVVDNTATSVTIEGTWDPIPDDTSEYQLVRPDAPVNGPFWDFAEMDGKLYAAPLNMDGGELWVSDDPAPGNWTQLITGGYGQPATQGFMTVTHFGEYVYLGTVVYPPLITDLEGTFGTEVLRVDAAGNVELLVGTTRDPGTPDEIAPTTGMGAGFGYGANVYSWTAHVHDGALYLGTFDAATLVLDPLEEMFPGGIPEKFETLLEAGLSEDRDRWRGFDYYRTTDGVTWTPICEDGLGNRENYGVRSMITTDHGLLLGAANPVQGFEMFLGTDAP